MKVFAISALLCAPALGSAFTHAELAQHHAPVILQETHDALKDLLTAFDFDHNWNGADNAENLRCFSDATQCAGSDNP